MQPRKGQKAQGTMRRGDLVEIEWVDIQCDSSWNDFSKIEDEEPTVCKDVGYYFKKTKEALTITNSVNVDSQASYTVFPLGCIVSVNKLRREN